MIVDELGRIPMSPFLTATLTRAADYATAQAHREVTLEHLLLALVEDPEASVVLKSSNVELARLTAEVSDFLSHSVDRVDPSEGHPVAVSHDLKRILEAAAAAAQQGRRREINGAIVLAAIVGDGKSTAAHLLRNQGLTFEEAIRALQKATAAPPPPQQRPAEPDGPPASTEEVLASARERINARTGGDGSSSAPLGTGRDSELAPQEYHQPAPLNERFGSQPAPYLEPPSPEAPAAWTAPEEPAFQPFPQAPDRNPQRHEEANSWAPLPEAPPARPAPAPRMPSPQLGPSPGRFGVPPPPPMPAAPHAPTPSARPSAPQPAPPWPEPPGELRRAPPRPAAPPTGNKRRASQGSGTFMGNWPLIEQGQLVENIPRSMRVGIPVVVEARIARADIKALAEGLQGGGAAVRHDVVVTKAMSMRLRAPDGGFVIETRSPETQWIENVLGISSDEYASWRWTITARERGKRQLQLIVSARTVGADGLTAETALPDQVIDVKVGINYAHSMKRWMGWALAAIVGGLLARFGETFYVVLSILLRRLFG
jgi:hypothetical protein